MTNKKTTLLTLGIILVLIVVGIYFLTKSNETQQQAQEKQSPDEPSQKMVEEKGEKAAKATQDLINETRKKQEEKEEKEAEETEEVEETMTEEEVSTTSEEMVDGEEETTPEPRETVKVYEDTNEIDVETGDVVTDEGEKVNAGEDADVNDLPKISKEMTEDDVPETGIHLKMYRDKIEPDTFTVQANQAVSLSVTDKDDSFHTFKFKDSSLSGMFLSVVGGETRSSTFNAPEEPGEYIYYDAMGNNEEAGATGIMIVE